MRLTEVKKNGEWTLKGVQYEELCAGKVITEELRQKLYGALCKLRDYENTGLSPEEVERVNDFGESQVARLMKKLQEEQEKHRWIPASERLPEENGTYLTTLDGELVGQEEPFTGMCGFENGRWDEEGCVIAWKPMPAPYEEDADEN